MTAAPLQFRLRTLFIATTASAILLWVFLASRLGLIAIYVAYFLLPAAVVSGIVFHRGYRQAFFIGTSPWIVTVSLWVAVKHYQGPGLQRLSIDFFDLLRADPESIITAKLYLTFPLFIAVVSGFVAVGMRWWAIRTQRSNN